MHCIGTEGAQSIGRPIADAWIQQVMPPLGEIALVRFGRPSTRTGVNAWRGLSHGLVAS